MHHQARCSSSHVAFSALGFMLCSSVLYVLACSNDGPADSHDASGGTGTTKQPSGGRGGDDSVSIAGLAGCGAICAIEQCGDGIRATSEACDDGNTTSGDGCNATCSSDETCGNGVVDTKEVCDDNNTTNGDGCNATCTSDETCHNGIVDWNEACDDGNRINTDDCVGNCVPASCGDGYVNQSPNSAEECDDGKISRTCNGDCTHARCGDLVINFVAGEECDTEQETAECDLGCTIPRCGDAHVNLLAHEACEDGNFVDGDGCNANCKAELYRSCAEDAQCAPGLVCDRTAEQNRCESAEVCGNARIETNETCDDGNALNGDGCSAICTVE